MRFTLQYFTESSSLPSDTKAITSLALNPSPARETSNAAQPTNLRTQP